MIKTHVCAVLLVLLSLQVAWAQSIEVKEIYKLRVDGKDVVLEKGRASQFKPSASKMSVEVVSGPSLQVRHQKIRFDLPAGLAREVDDDAESEYLTFDGNSVVVHLIRSKQALEPTTWRDEVISEITAGFGGGDQKPSDAVLATPSGELQGKALSTSLMGTVIRFEFFIIPTEKLPVMMILQDTADDDGQASQELRNIRATISDSLTF